MMLKKKVQYFLAIILVLGLVLTSFLIRGTKADMKVKSENLTIKPSLSEATVPETDTHRLLAIKTGDTYGVVMKESSLSQAEIMSLYEAAQEKYDLAQIRAGRNLELVFDLETNKFKELIYQIDNEQQIKVQNDNGVYKSELMAIPYEMKVVTKSGVIKSSLYEAALEQGIDERVIIALADAFQWTIDFALDPRVDDTFSLIYEERYLDNQYIAPGKVLAGKYVNNSQSFYIYYFDQANGESAYYDENGNAAQKMFLKAPVAFKYISSGFTTGSRYVEAFNVSTGHRAVDYAAALGTPIRAVGDGTVTMAAWNGPYGNMVSLRHNGTYSTNYGHMSKMAVKKGEKVKQGEIIGYVGSTGFSTGPHLHYEMVKNGVKINPLAEVMPPGKTLNNELKAVFNDQTKAWREALK